MAGRRLSPQEAALWRRVTESARALRPTSTVVDERPNPEPVDARPAGRTALRQAQNFANQPKPSQNTLDGTWDKSIATGRIVPDRTIDLHGCTLSAAHHRLDRGLDEAIRDGARVILLITGRPPARHVNRADLPVRGVIRASVGDWLAASRHRAMIAAVRNAHPRHGGAGALYIVFRRTRA